MNHCAMHQNDFAACEEKRDPLVAADRKQPLFCPKPRRLGQLTGADTMRPLRWLAGHQLDPTDSKAGAELLDIFLTKGGEVASSPPFFCGSPPSRAGNPVVHDARFGEDKLLPTPSGTSPMSPRKSCARAKLGLNPATVRIEGFECRLDRDRRSITAVA